MGTAPRPRFDSGVERSERSEMMRKTKSLFVFGVASLALALVTGDVAAQEILITPADPAISVGQTQQFTATGISTATALDAGSYHTCAILQDATVDCWGLNDYGQLGDGTQTNSSTPVAVGGVRDVATVTGGGFHTCARLGDGTLRCWGRNIEGQLGDQATAGWFSATPVPVTGITTALTVTGGGFHSCALLQNGTVRCWGQNNYGQLGDGTPVPTPATSRPTPVPVTVTGITTAVAIEAGIFHTCALLQDGTMQCWGWNDYYQLGNQSAINASSTPVTVDGITPASLAPGAEQSGRALSWTGEFT